jgi:hypothetical protein
MHLESSGVVNQMQKGREDITVEVLPQETDWLNLGI